jgi:Rrf2 family nitric oxide-sensitive transcriptional repressor
MVHFIYREADYALRIVAYLAGKKEKIKIKELCEYLYLSKPIVIKIVHKLRKCGIINTETGKNGGIKVSPTVGDIEINACPFICSQEGRSCFCRKRWSKA